MIVRAGFASDRNDHQSPSKSFSSMINPSKLYRLRTPVVDINQYQKLLNQFRDLLSIQFLSGTESISSEEIFTHVKTLMSGYPILHNSFSLWIWMGRRVGTTNARKRFKLSHPYENLWIDSLTNEIETSILSRLVQDLTENETLNRFVWREMRTLMDKAD